MKLYDYPQCPFGQKVRIVLSEKELSYELINVDLRRAEQKRPEFLKMNPFGKVPVLVDDDLVVYDSTVINEYLEDEYPHPRLLPEDSQARARARSLEDYADLAFILPVGLLMNEVRKPLYDYLQATRDTERVYVFPSQRSERLTEEGIYYWFRTLKAQGSRDQRAVIEELSFNDLRHDFAQRARAAGWLPEEVAYYLGQVTQQGMTALQTIVPPTPVSREQVKQKLNDIQG